MKLSLQTTSLDTTDIKTIKRFPDTRYMGSKRKLLPMISDVLDMLSIDSALDAFSGSGCVGYLMKQKGIETTTNDFLKFSYHITKATIENNNDTLTDKDIALLLKNNPKKDSFISTRFKDLYFSDEDNKFLDNLWSNIDKLSSPDKVSLALSSASRACMKRRARGIFTYTGTRYLDGRRDEKYSLKEHFVKAANEWSGAVFDNGKVNKALNLDVFDVPKKKYDLVYIDPPYVSPMSDNDYTRRYHFIEGLMSYWRDETIQEHTITKKIKSKPSLFSTKMTIHTAFDQLFDKFRDSILLVSYSSNNIPDKEEMIDLLKKYKKQVEVFEFNYTYSFGTHNHIVANSNNKVAEYLFLAK